MKIVLYRHTIKTTIGSDNSSSIEYYHQTNWNSIKNLEVLENEEIVHTETKVIFYE